MAKSNAKHPGGRPTVMTPMVVKKLEEAFAVGCSDAEACFYAGIPKQTLYNYQKKHPGFIDRKEALKERPILLARQKVVRELESDVKNAQWYLERKRKDEFSQKTELEHTGGEDPIKVLLDKFGVTEAIEDDRKNDEPVQSPPQSTP